MIRHKKGSPQQRITKVNLADLERRTGISRKRLRKLKKNGFVVNPHGLSGRKKGRQSLLGLNVLLTDSFKRELRIHP